MDNDENPMPPQPESQEISEGDDTIFQAEVVDAEVIDMVDANDEPSGGETLGSMYRTADPGKIMPDGPMVVNTGSPFAANSQPLLPAKPNKFVPIPVWMPEYERYSARAGAVIALFLGIVSIFGGLLTPMALINAFVGFLFGFWGLGSERKKTAVIGMVLCFVGFAVTFIKYAIVARF